ncbi:hypothetical protein HO173_004510 [Letharia columbiana]|uniref:Uncharacterized protein n=1 Tax=Letharia columbiana TaxID=112416 RepID=A0A8H6L6S8_9LECA|nr:uncharacterized protein HO173_004510 [Letharia columbiana]KAF6237620.1 hypothetical protein HO173_004510 [Letharia columbiana]
MAQLLVPNSGLALIDFTQSKPKDAASKHNTGLAQVMQLELPPNVLGDMLRSARHGGKGVNVQFGKTITLHYGNKSQPLDASPCNSSSTQIYESSTEDENKLALTGRLSHQLAMQKAQEDIAGADEALMKLQSQLASHQKDKQSKQIKYVPDNSKLPPPTKQTAAALKHQSVKTNPLSFLKKQHNPAHLNHTTRSMPVSPSLGAARTPLTQKTPPTSVPSLPNERAAKIKALRTPLIHFLAARPASITLLVGHLGCKQDELLEVLNKVGKEFRPIPDKWTLNDKAFKELDVWNFDYPNQDDRQLAINCAISAFDRMRISTKEKVWDMLLPKNERGKGKILSNLDLHKGPIKQSNTPRIHVQNPPHDSNASDHLTGHESDQKDRLAPSDAEPMARSQSQDQIKKKKVSEKEARSKRLLTSGPKKATPAPKVKEDHPAVKKGAKKANVPKSSEFVNDSDEEDGLEDAATLQAQSMTPKHVDQTLPFKAAASPPSIASTQKTVSISPKAPKPASSSRNIESTTAGKGSKSKPVTPSRSDATSKPKPAAANHEHSKIAKNKDVKSEKSETKNGKTTSTPPAKAHEKKPLPSGSSSPARRHRVSDSSQGSTAMKKTISRQRTTSSPHKPSPLGSSPPTNASDLENGASSASSTSLVSQAQKTTIKPNGAPPPVNGHAHNTSEHSLKRKADDLDANIHVHSNGQTNGQVNGAKRHKASAASPSTSESSNSPLATSHALKRAQDFKTYYAKYEVLYREVSESTDVPQEKIDNVKRMHQRLLELKDEITMGLVGI